MKQYEFTRTLPFNEVLDLK